MLKNGKGELEAVEWEDALVSVAKAMLKAGDQTAAVAGGLADAEVYYSHYSVFSLFNLLVIYQFTN